MAGLFSADGVIVLHHFFKNVTVADLCGYGPASMLSERFAKSKVAHDSSDNHGIIESSFFLHLKGIDQHQMIAVQDFALFINEKATICIAVIGDAAVSTEFNDGLLQCFHMRGTAAVIDIHAVGFTENGSHVSAEFS